MYTFQKGLQLRVAFSSMIYKKVRFYLWLAFRSQLNLFFFLQAINMRRSSSINSSSGKVINLLSFDTYRFDTAISLLHHIWKGPLEILVFGYFLYIEMGFYGWIGIAFIICFVPVQSEFIITFFWNGFDYSFGIQMNEVSKQIFSANSLLMLSHVTVAHISRNTHIENASYWATALWQTPMSLLWRFACVELIGFRSWVILIVTLVLNTVKILNFILLFWILINFS